MYKLLYHHLDIVLSFKREVCLFPKQLIIQEKIVDVQEQMHRLDLSFLVYSLPSFKLPKVVKLRPVHIPITHELMSMLQYTHKP